MSTTQFTKKPITITATQWFKPGDHPEVRDIAPTDDLYFTGMGGATLTDREKYGVIGTLESPAHLVSPGDWIITGVAGEHYPCKPDIFAATYDPAALTQGAGAVEPVAYRVRYRAEPGMIGQYPWAYIEADRAKYRKDAYEYEALYAAPPAHQLQQAVARALAPIQQAIRDYHYALDTRQHGDLAQSSAFNEISQHLGMHWEQGKEAAIRAKGPHQ